MADLRMQAYRQNVIDTMYKLIVSGDSQFAQTDDATRQRLSQELEKSCYVEAMKRSGMNESSSDSSQFRTYYHYYTTNIMWHCDSVNGLDLLNRIFTGVVPWNRAASLHYRDLDPAPTADEYEKFIVNRNELHIEKTKSGIYKCRKCGDPLVQKQAQLRRADESETLILTCDSCSYTIKL